MSLGEIVNVNAGAGNMFGYIQSEMVGMNLSAIMPQPFSSYHNMYMNHYCETGNHSVRYARTTHLRSYSFISAPPPPPTSSLARSLARSLSLPNTHIMNAS
jgi:hypothetical protein